MGITVKLCTVERATLCATNVRLIGDAQGRESHRVDLGTLRNRVGGNVEQSRRGCARGTSPR